jgi:hypothetical protein
MYILSFQYSKISHAIGLLAFANGVAQSLPSRELVVGHSVRVVCVIVRSEKPSGLDVGSQRTLLIHLWKFLYRVFNTEAKS